jgi:hypothetical protein
MAASGSWIPAFQSLRLHSKRKRLGRLLGIGLHETVGVIICLWWWALDEAENGDLSRFSDMDVADGADWTGDASAFVTALTEAGFLSEDRRLANWSGYVGRLISQREARREADRVRQQRYRQSLSERPGPPGSDLRQSHVPDERDSGVTDGDVTVDGGVTHATVTRESALNNTVPDRRVPEGATPPDGGAPPPPPEPPDELREFDERLRRMPGYSPSVDFYRIVLEKYSHLDLKEQAFLMTEWQADPQRNKKRRKGTTLFVTSWLKREVEKPAFTARSAGRQNGHAASALVVEQPPDPRPPAERWPGAMLLEDEDEPPDEFGLDGPFGGDDGRP